MKAGVMPRMRWRATVMEKERLASEECSGMNEGRRTINAGHLGVDWMRRER